MARILPSRTPKKEAKRSLDPFWPKKVDEIYMRFNMLQGYDRTTLMEWVGTALRDAYELGLSGAPYDLSAPEPSSPPAASAPVRRTRPAPPVILETRASGVVRRRTRD